MLKHVLRDYREGFRWKRFKETYHYTMLWYYLYMFCFFPLILDLNDKVEDMVGYYLVMIPVLLGLYSMSAIPIRLPKQMFLCPMTMAERRKYVNMLFWVRYLGTVSIGTVSYLIAVVAGVLPAVFLPIQLVGLYATIFAASITTWPGSTWERDEKQKKRLKNPEFKGLYPSSIIAVLLGIFLQFFQPFGLIEEATMGTWIFLGIYSVITVGFSVFLIRYMEPVLKMTINYEYSYDVVNKAPKK